MKSAMPADQSADDPFETRRASQAAAYWSKRKHRRQVRALLDLLPPQGTFIDVGGYLGNVTAQLLAARSCRAVVFEPVGGHFEFCFRRFAGDPRVTVERLALSDAAGELPIYRGHKNLAWNTMLSDMANSRNLQLPPETVRCVAFDDYRRAARLDHVDLVKIDVEGYEWKALRGMRESIAEFLPHLEIEIHFGRRHPAWDEQAEVFEGLFQLGYARFDPEKRFVPRPGRGIVHVLLRSPRARAGREGT